MNLINERDEEENHPNRLLTNDCKELVIEVEAKIVHIFREANRCADVLAHIGSKQAEPQVHMLIPPNEVVEEMLYDLKGVAYGRETYSCVFFSFSVSTTFYFFQHTHTHTKILMKKKKDGMS